ncbi:aminopeptidase P family protein [Pseudogemmobacter faecipullorum]|uniref:Aminopeptidase P family protein n=1 Tax=Pseudogemmobacter faecipullorum TaxID=2755041 RepID=A0ABS8CK37_9RHOB|nr:aminopeptidase P family protein [Pseudogemmobacter faecipullorum]MCB5409235.1 aminopeptidase P family protein [Pseudogemmobacter faecipullorum]
MFQSFDSAASPGQGPARLSALREAMHDAGLEGFIVPRADVYQGEYVAPGDARLEWLTGFTGSAGFCIALQEAAGVFIDGRYRTQVKAQVDLAHFSPVAWPEIRPGDWLRDNLSAGVVGFDPWLHTADEIARIEAALQGTAITLRPCDNLVDAIWPDRPAPPAKAIFLHADDLAGESAAAKRQRLGAELRKSGERVAVLTQPDSICWLLNIRGQDVPRNPVAQAFAFLFADDKVTLFTPRAGENGLAELLGPDVSLALPEAFSAALSALQGPVRLDRLTAPLALSQILSRAGVEARFGEDPCRLPKACKNPGEITHTREAHLRDGAAMAEFLCWLDREAPGDLTEIAVVRALEEFRRASNALFDISFDTICGAGPDGAIIHYRVTEETDRALQSGELLLVDSGAQYQDGTTDITRTIAIGDPGEEARICYTAVLRGMIAISRARWPRGLAGRDLDALARQHLWSLGLDYDHGTGHGVGAFLSVHEGPQRISRVSEVALQPGMILSNEPGYYREGAFGIRLENLIVVDAAEKLGDGRDQLSFETLTFAPFDRRLVLADQLSQAERAWLDAYHAEVLAKIGPRVSAETLSWLERACAPL